MNWLFFGGGQYYELISVGWVLIGYAKDKNGCTLTIYSFSVS